MARFRKKPVVIEAIPVAEVLSIPSAALLPRWLQLALDAGNFFVVGEHVRIRTLEGSMIGEKDDWIIRGVQGELYPCKPDIFAATYEPAE